MKPVAVRICSAFFAAGATLGVLKSIDLLAFIEGSSPVVLAKVARLAVMATPLGPSPGESPAGKPDERHR